MQLEPSPSEKTSARDASADNDHDNDYDDVVHLHGATWADYERLLEIRGESAVPRISYIEGLIEIMTPSRSHELDKSAIGRLVEVWCLEHDVRFTTVGSWTLKSKKQKRGAEPDECYIIGEPRNDDDGRPDIAIEVERSRSGIDKLEIYRKLGVREVWRYRRGVLTVHVLEGEQYVAAQRSTIMPALDLDELVTFLDYPTTFDAIRAYRAALLRGR